MNSWGLSSLLLVAPPGGAMCFDPSWAGQTTNTASFDHICCLVHAFCTTQLYMTCIELTGRSLWTFPILRADCAKAWSLIPWYLIKGNGKSTRATFEVSFEQQWHNAAARKQLKSTGGVLAAGAPADIRADWLWLCFFVKPIITWLFVQSRYFEANCSICKRKRKIQILARLAWSDQSLIRRLVFAVFGQPDTSLFTENPLGSPVLEILRSEVFSFLKFL